MKIAVFGNTRQTLKGLQRLVSSGYDVQYVFGLPDELRDKKVNSVSLDKFCDDHKIFLDGIYIKNKIKLSKFNMPNE